MKILRAAAPPILVSVYFLALTAPALSTYFSPDDSMNLWDAWEPPARVLLRANLLFFLPSPLPRPLASAWLRSTYWIAGFHPAPFKAINLAILVANIFLTYAVARRLTASRTCGAVTALITAYHGKAVHLYFDVAYIFDVLCCFFFFCALWVYLRARGARRFLNSGELAAFCILFVCALNSKEIAITLPAFLLIYEVLYHGTGRRSAFAPWRRWVGTLASGGIALAVIVGRILPGPLIHISPYRPVVTWAQLMKTSLDFAGNLFLAPGLFTPAALVALWIVMLALAWALHSRPLQFAWLFLMLSPLPIAFILPRGLAQYYVPLFGWALYAAVLVSEGFGLALRRFPAAISMRTRVYAGAALLVGIELSLYPLWKSYSRGEPGSVFVEAEDNRSIVQQLHHLEPRLRPRARLIFLDDPIRPDWFNLTFLVRLSYRDRDIVVHRAKFAGESERPADLSGPGLAAYDRVFDYRNGYFRELSAPWARGGPMPAVVLEHGRAQIFHAGWTPVDRNHPAHAGEEVIVKAADLGETLPRLPPGQTFSQDPLAKVIAQIGARIDARPATITTKVGWPGESDRYRLDIRIPADAPRGSSWMDLSTNGITGPAAEFPIR
jgi:hypothetical protein